VGRCCGVEGAAAAAGYEGGGGHFRHFSYKIMLFSMEISKIDQKNINNDKNLPIFIQGGDTSKVAVAGKSAIPTSSHLVTARAWAENYV
jgi:hypothetical protein